MMRRREFIAGLGGAVAWPVTASAQQAERVVGVLMGGAATDREFQSWSATSPCRPGCSLSPTR
jgi:hypothetical protein